MQCLLTPPSVHLRPYYPCKSEVKHLLPFACILVWVFVNVCAQWRGISAQMCFLGVCICFYQIMTDWCVHKCVNVHVYLYVHWCTVNVNSERWPEQDRHVYNSVSTDGCVWFSSAIYLRFAIQALHSAALTPLDKEVTDSVTKSSLFQPIYKNNRLDLKAQGRKNITFLAWLRNIQKKPCPFYFRCRLMQVITALPLAHKTLPQLQKLGSDQPGYMDPNQRGYVGLQLHLSL